jgi:CheY-like chemotaxis protein
MAVVLIADDDAAIRTIYAKALTHAGYDIMEAADGEEALDRARKDAPDLIILDFSMPKRSGLECLAELKADRMTREIPVIALTGFSGIESRVAASASGADAFLAKPVEPRDVIDAVEAFIGPGRRSYPGMHSRKNRGV